MNNDHRGTRATRPLRSNSARACLSALTCAALAACANPLRPERDDYGPKVPGERLRTVARLRLDDVAKPRPLPDTPPTEPPADPFFGLERVDVSIEQARAWTIANNLDLQVALVEPTIQRERLSEEEARFEWVFTTALRYNNIDQPAASGLENNQGETFNLIPGVRIPLLSGGTATVQLPINYTQTSAALTVPETYETDLAFSISQPLLRNAGRRTQTHFIRIQALESQIAEARAKLEVIRQLANVDRAYWRLYAAYELLKVRQEQYELARTQLAQAERRVRAQVAPEVEIIRAQSGVAERLEAIIVAQNAVRDLQRELKRIMNQTGLKIGDQRVVQPTTRPDPMEYELDPEFFADRAVANRMEMLELELRLAQDYSTIDFQKNQALPLFTLDYRYAVNGLGTTLGRSLRTLRENDFEDWSVGATLEVPLGNEAAEARVHQAILRRLQRLSTKEAREQAIRQEVYNAVDTLYASWQRILASRQAAILAARTLRAEQNQFEVGARTSTDVLDAATRLADAQSAEIRALADYQIALVDLAFATGTLLGAAKVDWQPRDPRTPADFVGERRGRTPRGPAGVEPAPLTPQEVERQIERRPGDEPVPPYTPLAPEGNP